MRNELLSAFLILFFLAGCGSLPRIIVLNDPLDARQHNDLGVAYEQRQEYDLALREYDRAAELDEDWPLPLFNKGNVHARLTQWPEAVEAYRAALERDPEAARVMNNLAWVLIEKSEVDRGIAMAERAVAADETNPNYWDTLAAAYQAADRMTDAQTAAERGLALNPPPPLRNQLEKKVQAVDETGSQTPE